jgi:GxxExxY protein
MECLERNRRGHKYDNTDYTDYAQMNEQEKYPLKELTEKIIGAAYEVHNTLGSGFVEKVYENALTEELREYGFLVEQQKPVSVIYKGKSAGEFIADMVVEKKVLVEVKSVKMLTKDFDSKLIHYLKATGIEVGLLINFGESVQVRRKINTPKLKNKSVLNQ